MGRTMNFLAFVYSTDPCAMHWVEGVSKGAYQEVSAVIQVTEERAVVIRRQTCFARSSGKTCRLTACGRCRGRREVDSRDSDWDTY